MSVGGAGHIQRKCELERGPSKRYTMGEVEKQREKKENDNCFL